MVKFEDLDEIEEEKKKTPLQKAQENFYKIYSQDLLNRFKDPKNGELKKKVEEFKEQIIKAKTKELETSGNDEIFELDEESNVDYHKLLLQDMRNFYAELRINDKVPKRKEILGTYIQVIDQYKNLIIPQVELPERKGFFSNWCNIL